MFSGIRKVISNIFDNDNAVANIRDTAFLISKLKTDLINCDISVNFINKMFTNILNNINKEKDSNVNIKNKILSLINSEIRAILGENFEGIKLQKDKITVIMLCGPHGTGKTSFCIKLCNKIKRDKKNIRIATCSVDLKRSAAQQQLKNLSKKNNIDYIDIKEHALANITSAASYLKSIADKSGYSVLVVDTQGASVMNLLEMKKLINVKNIMQIDETLLILDTTMGQVSTNIALKFNSLLGIDGIVLTKVDSDVNGGMAINVRNAIDKPIKYLSIGENINDIEEFHPQRIANRILNISDEEGMKDYLKNSFTEESQTSLADKISSGNFDFNDLYDQLIQINKNDSFSSILRFLPDKISQDRYSKKRLITKQIAIILSMTKKERQNPEIIDKSCTQRIANGSGSNVSDVIDVMQRLVRLKTILQTQKQ